MGSMSNFDQQQGSIPNSSSFDRLLDLRSSLSSVKRVPSASNLRSRSSSMGSENGTPKKSDPKIVRAAAGYVLEDVPHVTDYIKGLPCALMVDYFAPLFFTEISTTQPELFREKVNLCGKMVPVSLPKRSDACTLCHHVVAEVLNKLHMPDTQLEIIETLMKGCSKLQDFVQECKQLVFQYGPAIVAKAEKYLEGKDICAHIHECKSASLGDLLLSSA